MSQQKDIISRILSSNKNKRIYFYFNVLARSFHISHFLNIIFAISVYIVNCITLTFIGLFVY